MVETPELEKLAQILDVAARAIVEGRRAKAAKVVRSVARRLERLAEAHTSTPAPSRVGLQLGERTERIVETTTERGTA